MSAAKPKCPTCGKRTVEVESKPQVMNHERTNTWCPTCRTRGSRPTVKRNGGA